MDGFTAVIAGLDGLSIIIGVFGGFVCAMLVSRLNRRSVLNYVSDHLTNEVKSTFENVTETIETSVKNSSSEALKDNQQQFLTVANDKLDTQTQHHSTELDNKKELIDQQLESMSKSMTETLNTVPTELEKNQNKVADVLDKSTRDLKDSNQSYLNQLTEKAETQTKEHNKELDAKKELIDQRLTDMDAKLGKVERLVQDLQTDRKAQYGALGQQLQDLTQTTTSLQQALADNRARGQWGERMAEDMLNFMGLVENVNYIKQASIESGSRPDFTFLLPNQKQLNMDAKFPLDNYMLYFNAESDADKKEYSQKFLRDVSQRVAEIQNRGYISAETLDCVLIFIPNEQVYRFIHEQDESIIDRALRQKVILCSPLTLYIVLAVIHQAAQNFNIEQRSREIVSIVEEIRFEWGKYSNLMDGMGKNFATLQNKFNQLTMTRTKALDRKFDKIEHIVNSSDDLEGEQEPLLISEN